MANGNPTITLISCFVVLCSGPLSLSDLEAIEVGLGGAATTTNRPARSNPVNMPLRSNPQSINDTSLYIGSLCTFSVQYSAARLLAKPVASL